MDFSPFYSESISGMKKSVIRELLKLTQRKEIISFAGGLPDPKLFPIDDIKECSNSVLNSDGAAALQYGTTEGVNDLRSILVERYNTRENCHLTIENLVVTTASQQGLDLLGRVFINKGDAVIVGLPSYLGGLNAFSSYDADLKGIELDDNGIIPAKLEAMIQTLLKEGRKPKFIYVVPDFQNPAGVTIDANRRIEIYNIVQKYDLLLVEDVPYRELRYEGEHQPMFQSMDTDGRVISLGSMSKVLSPGFRIGWVVGHPEIVDKFVTAKQMTDLCTSALLQMITAQYFRRGMYDRNLDNIIKSYGKKRDVMLSALEEFMPDNVTWTRPEGGLFLFLKLPESMDSNELFLKAIEKDVAFVIGNAFYCDGTGKNTMRLNFSFASEEENREGIRRLAEAIKEMM